MLVNINDKGNNIRKHNDKYLVLMLHRIVYQSYSIHKIQLDNQVAQENSEPDDESMRTLLLLFPKGSQ